LALNVPAEKVHIRRRHTKLKEGPRYSKIDSKEERIEVMEGELKFLVNLSDFLDTAFFQITVLLGV
jgi:23S rRNA G2069 N7-methylase RlmK/C1962 C5-methylase RlmI